MDRLLQVLSASVAGVRFANLFNLKKKKKKKKVAHYLLLAGPIGECELRTDCRAGMGRRRLVYKTAAATAWLLCCRGMAPAAHSGSGG